MYNEQRETPDLECISENIKTAIACLIYLTVKSHLFDLDTKIGLLAVGGPFQVQTCQIKRKKEQTRTVSVCS
jgi:hypothetical protein